MDKVDYREILRLQSLGYSLRSIYQSVCSSHHTVSDVLNSAARNNITWSLDSDITNLELSLLLFPVKMPPPEPSLHGDLDPALPEKLPTLAGAEPSLQ